MRISLPLTFILFLLLGCVSQDIGPSTNANSSLSASTASAETSLSAAISIGFTNGEFMTLENAQTNQAYTDKNGIERVCSVSVFNGQKFQYIKLDGVTLRVTSNGSTYILTHDTNFSGTRSINGNYMRQFIQDGVQNQEAWNIQNNILSITRNCDI